MRWRHTSPRRRPRRVVLLVDVSGSMEPYARALLRFAHAAVSARGRSGVAVEAFALGTRLTRLTRELIWAAIHQVGDWPTNGNRRKLQAWWKAIGPKAQRLVEAAFVALNSVEEEDVEMFLEQAIYGSG